MSTKAIVADTYGPPLCLDESKTVMAAAESLAEREGLAVTIAILESTGHLTLLHKRDQAHYGSIDSAQTKAQTALNFRRSTHEFQEALAGGALRLLSVRGLTPIRGGIPLVRDGQVVGAIGVSGASADDDERVAAAGAEALPNAGSSSR